MNKKDLNRYVDTITFKRSMRRIPLVAAVIFICILTTTVLALNLGLHEKLMEYFNIGEQQGVLLENSVDTPELSLSKNGVTITVKQTIADKYGIYVLYEMTVPDNIELSDHIGWYMDFLNVKQKQKENAGAIGRNDILEQSAHHRIGLLSTFATSAEIEKGPIKLSLRDLGYWNSEMNFVTLVEGDWELNWELSNNDSGKTFVLDRGIDIAGKNAVIKEVSISPISINITATESGVLNTPIYIVFRDGTRMAIDETSGRSNPGGTLIDENNLLYEYQLYHRFYHIIDPKEVKGIIINDKEINLK